MSDPDTGDGADEHAADKGEGSAAGQDPNGVETGGESLLRQIGIPPDTVTAANVHQVLLGMAQFTAANELTTMAKVVTEQLAGAMMNKQAEKARLEHSGQMAWIWLTALAMVLFCAMSALALWLAARNGSIRDAAEPIALVAVVLGAGGAVAKSSSSED